MVNNVRDFIFYHEEWSLLCNVQPFVPCMKASSAERCYPENRLPYENENQLEFSDRLRNTLQFSVDRFIWKR